MKSGDKGIVPMDGSLQNKLRMRVPLSTLSVDQMIIISGRCLE